MKIKYIHVPRSVREVFNVCIDSSPAVAMKARPHIEKFVFFASEETPKDRQDKSCANICCRLGVLNKNQADKIRQNLKFGVTTRVPRRRSSA